MRIGWRDVAGLHRLDQLAQVRRQIVQAERADQAGVGLRRRVRDLGGELLEVLAADRARARIASAFALARFVVRPTFSRLAVAGHARPESRAA